MLVYQRVTTYNWDVLRYNPITNHVASSVKKIKVYNIGDGHPLVTSD
jgi:hypothetical protein